MPACRGALSHSPSGPAIPRRPEPLPDPPPAAAAAGPCVLDCGTVMTRTAAAAPRPVASRSATPLSTAPIAAVAPRSAIAFTLPPEPSVEPLSIPAATRRMAELLRGQVTADAVCPSPVPGVHYMHCGRHIPSRPLVYEPGVCVLAAGRKVVRVGGQSFTYDADTFLVLSVALPVECEVFASADDPVLGVRIDVDPAVLAELILETGGTAVVGGGARGIAPPPPSASAPPPSGIFASRFTDGLRDACLRLVECLGSPADARILGPGIVREIHYRILGTDQAAALRAVAVRHARFTQISRALQRIHAEYAADLSVDALAAEAAMSASSFHENFRAVTSTSPLQYLKTIRLHKARVLMIRQGATAAEAAARVGYESPSQFSREFKRLFGATPAREAATSRAALLPA